MPYPPGPSNLTGATRYRSGFRGVLILQVEETVIDHFKYIGSLSPEPVHRAVWRDASTKDLRVLEYIARRGAAETNGHTPPPPPDWDASGSPIVGEG